MIRKIVANDFPIIYNLGSQYDKDFTKKYNLELYLNNNLYVMDCFEEDNIIKGFVIGTNIDKTVEIYLIFVEEKYRHKQIATKLLTNLEVNNKEIILEVSTDNEGAYNLYKKLGYKEISIRKGYYKGIDAIIMKKVLM